MNTDEEAVRIRVEQIFGHKDEIKEKMLTGHITSNTIILHLRGVSDGAVG
jgi:hypothetical protein